MKKRCLKNKNESKIYKQIRYKNRYFKTLTLVFLVFTLNIVTKDKDFS